MSLITDQDGLQDLEKASSQEVAAEPQGRSVTDAAMTSENGPKALRVETQGSTMAQIVEEASTVSAEWNGERLRSRTPPPPPPPPPPKDEKYLDFTFQSGDASPRPENASTGATLHDSQEEGVKEIDAKANVAPPGHTGTGFDDDSRRGGETVGKEALFGEPDSRSEIQSIMEQFEDGRGGPGAEEIMSPRLEFAGSMMGSPLQHPPRSSSLEAFAPLVPTKSAQSIASSLNLSARNQPSVPQRRSSTDVQDATQLSSPTSPTSIFKPPPPEPDPEPDLPFDFHRFLEQLRHRTADPVAKFLRSFLTAFGKKQWMVHEQVKLISDFLAFIATRMAQCEVWRNVSEAEFDNAREGMEKLVMNRLYNQTFSPVIPPSEPVTPVKGRRRAEQPPPGFGRRGQHQEDVERDQILAQKVRIYGWVREQHLDIKPVGDKGKKFLVLAQQELLKINSYRAPRDKVICILNSCKVIFGMLRNSQSDQSADAFVPLLIYTVLHANPDHLVSNVLYITRFRNQEKLSGEAGYYISSLMGVIQFIENLDRTSLTVSDDEFEKNVEAAVSAIAERPEEKDNLSKSPPGHLSEKSSLSRPEITPRNSMQAERSLPSRSTSLRNGNDPASSRENEENAAVAGLLRTIQKPLSTIGRIFSDDGAGHIQRQSTEQHPALTPQPGATPRVSPVPAPQPRRGAGDDVPQTQGAQRRSMEHQRERMNAEDAAARQASAEAAEAVRIQRAEHRTVVETLAGMFPNLDKEVIDDVVRTKEGRVGLAVDACLALTNP